MKNKYTHEGHRERIRKLYIEHGLDNFEDHQVLELLLYYCIARKDTNEMAHKMINEFGTLYNLFEADPLYIMQKCKVSENVAVLVSLIPSLSRRYFRGKFSKRIVLDTSCQIGNLAISLLAGKHNECFYCICLDNRRHLIAAPKISEGTVNEAQIYPRQVADAALKYKAVSVVLAHNHPSGVLEPSQTDYNATIKIKDALEFLEIEVLDHIIVGGDCYYSFAENNKAGLGMN